MSELLRPAIEGTVAVRDGRRLSFAEYGSIHGPAIVWMHGTPGGRRQIPLEARSYAVAHGLRIIGVDRPGIGSSTPYLYDNVLAWTEDLAVLLDTLGVDTLRLIGLSGGGPYALAAGAAMPDRVHGIAVPRWRGADHRRRRGSRRHRAACRATRAAAQCGSRAARDRPHPGHPPRQAPRRDGPRPLRRRPAAG